MADDLPATSSTGAMGSSGARASGGGMLGGGARSTAGSVSGYGGQYSGSGRKLSRSYWWWAASGSLSASSQGVIGLPGISLSTQTSTPRMLP